MVSHIASAAGTPRLPTETERLRGGPRGSAPAGTSRQDILELSPGAGALPAALAGGPPIDAALVGRIGAAIADGHYPVDPDRIADALMKDHADLFG